MYNMVLNLENIKYTENVFELTIDFLDIDFLLNIEYDDIMEHFLDDMENVLEASVKFSLN